MLDVLSGGEKMDASTKARLLFALAEHVKPMKSITLAAVLQLQAWVAIFTVQYSHILD